MLRKLESLFGSRLMSTRCEVEDCTNSTRNLGGICDECHKHALALRPVAISLLRRVTAENQSLR